MLIEFMNVCSYQKPSKKIDDVYLLEAFVGEVLDVVVDQFERVQLEPLEYFVVDALEIVF